MKSSNLPKGVSLDTKRHLKKYKAIIKQGGKLRHLGYFYTAEEAHAAYLKAKSEPKEKETNT